MNSLGCLVHNDLLLTQASKTVTEGSTHNGCSNSQNNISPARQHRESIELTSWNYAALRELIQKPFAQSSPTGFTNRDLLPC